ncbi:hypothetical protein TH2_041 [Shewanella phage Thanatos-2]|nr:hypothetical protein TH2_041 [Shewanella phage Thanatos-2]
MKLLQSLCQLLALVSVFFGIIGKASGLSVTDTVTSFMFSIVFCVLAVMISNSNKPKY